MTEEFRLLKRLFAEDTEPGEGAWAKLRRRIGSAGEATPGGSSSHSTPVDPVAGHSGALASAGGAAAGAEGVAVAGATNRSRCRSGRAGGGRISGRRNQRAGSRGRRGRRRSHRRPSDLAGRCS